MATKAPQIPSIPGFNLPTVPGQGTTSHPQPMPTPSTIRPWDAPPVPVPINPVDGTIAPPPITELPDSKPGAA